MIMIKKITYFGVILLIIIFLVFYCFWIYPTLPRNINPYPLIDNKSIAKHWSLTFQDSSNLTDNNSLTTKDMGFLIPIQAPANYHGYSSRQIDICKFKTNYGALKKYNISKVVFTDSLNYKLYKEGGNSIDKFFIIYKTKKCINHNHGLPIGTYIKPDVKTCFLKNNLFITTSISEFSDNIFFGSNYIEEMNADILFISDYLKK
jgi:hypothetical protein